MDTFKESIAEHAAEDAVRFDRSIEARSARIDCGFWFRSARFAAPRFRERQLTIMYDITKFRNDGSERGATSNGESDRLTSARKASWATVSMTIRSR